MSANPRLDTLTLYSFLMGEVKARSAAMYGAIEGKTQLPPFLVREFCYLQLRFVCELIAMACLVAHGEIEGTASNKLTQEWAADKILARLGQLHSDFYPHPHKFERIGPNRVHMGEFTGPYMTRDGLIALWRKCGSVLHRGPILKLAPPTDDLSEVEDAREKIIGLLNFHRIAMLGGQRHLICVMANDQGAVHVADIEPEPFQEPPASPPSQT